MKRRLTIAHTGLLQDSRPRNVAGERANADDPAAAPLPESLTRWPGFLLAWVADMGGRLYAQALAELGIRPQHLAILTLLDAEGPMVQARLGDRLTIVKPAVVGLVNELEAMALVQRRPHPHDGRAFEVYLMASGKERIRDAEAVSYQITEAFFSDLSQEERQVFERLLTRLASSNARKNVQE